MKTKNTLRYILPCFLSIGISASGTSQAATFDVMGQLTGDARNGNPSGLIIDVDISVVDNIASWTIDLNSPSHPDIRLDEFYFNLANVNAGDVVFSNFSPAGWLVNSPASTVGGGNFNPNFLFETTDQIPNPSNNPTNLIDFTFDATLNRNWSLDDFLMAAVSSSSDTILGSGQMGAHLQSLTVDGVTCPQNGCSDSGFALGNYEVPTNPDDPPNDVPEPTSLLLLSIGLLGFFGASRKKS